MNKYIAFWLLSSCFVCNALDDGLIHCEFLDEFAQYAWTDTTATCTTPVMEMCISVQPPATISVVDAKGILYLQVEKDFTVTGTMIPC